MEYLRLTVQESYCKAANENRQGAASKMRFGKSAFKYEGTLKGYLTLLFVLCAADLLITFAALPLGAMEINPVMAEIIHTPQGIMLKLIGSLAVVAWLWHRRNETVLKLAKWLVGGYGFVVMWNLWVFVRLAAR